MELRKDERLEEAMGEVNLWVQRLNEAYGAWQVGWESADEGMQKACGEIALASRRVEGALLALKTEGPQLESPAIDLSELQAQFDWSEE